MRVCAGRNAPGLYRPDRGVCVRGVRGVRGARGVRWVWYGFYLFTPE